MNYRTLARKIAKGDQRKAKLWRGRIRYWMASSPAFQEAVATAAMGELRLAVPKTTQALISVATKRKRVDAIKLVMEASGFHNPRIQHEHSGDIQITLSMPRPGQQESLNPGKEDPGPIVEADVVEET